MHGILFIDLEGYVVIKVIKKLASWCSRYSIILASLKPLSVSLHGEHAGIQNRKVQKLLSMEAKVVCWVWRAFLILIALKPDGFARKIMSFRNFDSWFRIEYDASLTGLGVIISTKVEQKWSHIKIISFMVPYELN